MRTYTMTKIQGKPNWKKIPYLSIDNLLWTDSIDVSAKAQLCWDENALYVRMEAVEPNIRMKERGPLANVCFDSCMEFFFQPTQRPDYFNIELNPLKTIFLGFGTGREDLIRLQVRGIQKLFNIRVRLTKKGWVLSYQIPFAFIRRFFPEFEAKEGGFIRANIYKCGDKTAKEHYLTWNHITSEEPDFHRPEYFAPMYFGGEE
ncbi:MAG: carbohydrate-binding family 9-like protein [Oscillospiraceae bacterium]|nr:carbohydrate-binding family 9-like protein [Oscillospiraceae bacterium]